MSHYDTREIRAAASRVRRLSDQLSAIRSSSLPQMLQSAKSMQGDTVNAIRNQLDDVSGEIQSVQSSLISCAQMLFTFANELDEADRKAQENINSK